MLEILHSVFESTIQFYEYAFLLIHALLNSFGWAIIALSCIISTILFPLIRFCANSVNRVNEYEKVLTPQIDRIKQESSGETQHRRLVNLYRRYSYSPFFALIKVGPLFVQLPALFLTFYMLSNLSELKGVSFFSLQDLSAPDQLFFGVNLLPIVMTLLNILAAITTPGFKKNDLIQASIIALIFLIILYPLPSSLLLYWTINNAILLARNIFNLIREEKNSGSTHHSKEVIFLLKSVVFNRHCLTIAAFIYTLIVIRISAWADIPNSTLLLVGFLLCLPLILQIFTIRSATKNLTFLQASLFFLIVTLGLCGVYHSLLWLAAYAVIFIINIPFLLLTIHKNIKQKSKFDQIIFSKGLSNNKTNIILLGYLAFILYLILIDNPLTVFSYAPEDFYGITFTDLLSIYLCYFSITLSFFIFLIWICPRFIKEKLFPFTIFIALATFFYSKIFIPDYGLMDDFSFNQPHRIRQNIIISLSEIILLISAFLFLIHYLGNLINHHTKIILLLFSTSMITFSISLINMFANDNLKGVNSKNTPSKAEATSAIKNATDFDLQLSSHNKNVLIILLDGFSAGKLPELMKNNEEIASGLKDFTWYKNTITSHSGTIGALPGITGGHNYTVNTAISNGKDGLDEVFNSALPILPKHFEAKGYHTSWVAIPRWLPSSTALNNHNIHTERYAFKAELSQDDFSAVKTSMNKTLLMISIFRASPLFQKDFIYQGGNWGIYGGNISIGRYALKSTKFNFLDKISSNEIVAISKPTFTFLHLEIPHNPWVMTEEGMGSIYEKGEYIHEAKHSLLKLSLLFENMKQAGVYDNTQIQIIADHGWWVENPLFSPSFTKLLGTGYSGRRKPGFIHTLMLTKQPYITQSTMRTSTLLMSNADTPSLACEIILGCEGILPLPEIQSSERTLTHNIIDISIGKKERFRDKLKEQWEVKGSIFEEKNWSQIY